MLVQQRVSPPAGGASIFQLGRTTKLGSHLALRCRPSEPSRRLTALSVSLA